jgi:uncharacterized membrane protein YidH (DUF202 family)
MAKSEKSTKGMLLSEKRTHLAEKRTQLAFERSVMAYIRTATTLILFGIAFFGLSKAKGDFFYAAGIAAIIIGATFALVAMERALTHSKEIKKIEAFFAKIIKFRYKK